jgi:hypothetical protein
MVLPVQHFRDRFQAREACLSRSLIWLDGGTRTILVDLVGFAGVSSVHWPKADTERSSVDVHITAPDARSTPGN